MYFFMYLSVGALLSKPYKNDLNMGDMVSGKLTGSLIMSWINV